MNTVLPWHDTLWQQIMRRWLQERLPHALLLCGSQGMGKGLFAQRLAKTLLCENVTLFPINKEDKPPSLEESLGDISAKPCLHCKPCQLFRAETHPDLLQIQPVEAGKQISVDQIRKAIRFCGLTAGYGCYQIIIINPAEAMNRNAANSLLKLLEEPPPKTLIMLVSHQPMALVATIRSRCQRLDFSRPDSAVIQTWLQAQLKDSRAYDIPLLLNLSAQAPFAALALAETDGIQKRRELFEHLTDLLGGKNDPVCIAEGWSQQNGVQILLWMHSWTMDIIRIACTAQTQYLVNRDYQEALQRFAKQFDLHRLFQLLDLQKEAYQLMMGKSNVKAQGLLESIAIAWVKLGVHRGRST